MGLRLDLGGGTRPRRDGFVNVDARPLPEVDCVCDFEKLAEAGREGARLPFDDDSVEKVYSAHCLEHVWPYRGFLHEIARVCRVGASVEIRVPHWNCAMAKANDHKHTVPPEQVRHWCEHFIEDWWAGSAKRLKLLDVRHVPGATFAEAKGLFPHLSDDQIMRLVPDACHEIGYMLEVVENR